MCEIPNEGVSTQQGPQDSSWRPEGWGAIPHHCNQLWLETPSSAQCSVTGTSPDSSSCSLTLCAVACTRATSLYSSCFWSWRMWLNECSCQDNLSGMRARHSAPTSLSPAWMALSYRQRPQFLPVVTLQGSPHGNPFGTVQAQPKECHFKIRLFLYILHKSSYNQSFWVGWGLCKTLSFQKA